MKKVIIDGIEYVPVTPEVKEEKRLEGYTDGYVSLSGAVLFYLEKLEDKDTRMIEIREGEIIVSENDVRKALANSLGLSLTGGIHFTESKFLKELFKKDGV